MLHNNLLSHAHRAHNCLTFSDFVSACCFAPPRICAAPAIKSKQTERAEILPKTKARLHQSQSPAPVPWLLIHPAPAIYGFPGCPGQSSSKANTQAHTNITHNTKQWNSKKREKTLPRNNACRMRQAVGQGDRQGRSGPERGGSTAARKTTLQQNALLQEVTVKTETMDVREARLQDLRA